MQCEILVSKKTGQVIAGTLTLKDGKIEAEPTHGYEVLMDKVMAEPSFSSDGKVVDRYQDPEAWFNALPKRYNGIYMRARLVGK